MLLTVISGLITLAALTCQIAPASAGTYDVWSCRGPVGEPLSGDAWKVSTSFADPGDTSMSDGCATGGPLDIRLTDSGTGNRKARINLELKLPPDVTVTGYRLNRAVRAAIPTGPGAYVAATGETTGIITEDWGCASNLALPYFSCSFEGSPLDPDDPSNQWVRSGLSLDGLRLWAGCVTSTGCDPAASPPAAYYVLWGSRVTLEENDAPTVVSVDGTLTEPGSHRGEANLFVWAADSGSGVASMDLDIDGMPYQSMSSGAGSCVEPYEVADPCPAGIGHVFTVDRSALDPGTHVATGTVTDAAGNQTAFGPVHFTVNDPDPGTPLPDNGVPAVSDPLINLNTGDIWQKPGAAAVIAGRLTTQAGLPVAGAVLVVGITQLGVADLVEARSPDVTTGPDGRFSIPVPGSGARQVGISFAAYPGAAVSSRASVRVRSRLGLTLRPKPAKIRIGRKVRFKGRLTGAGPSAARVPIEIQAKTAGKWQSVATVRSRSGGNWNWTYRFRYVKRNAVFSFRAVVHDGPGWPWPLVKSPVRKVRIKVGRH